LILCGGGSRGTLYAVYDFLEQDLGCAWLDPDTEIIPRRSTLTVNAGDRSKQPAFMGRDIYTGFYYPRASEELMKKYAHFVIRNKGNGHDARYYPEFGFSEKSGSPGPHHTFGLYISPEEFSNTHPEYFSLNPEGKRDLGKGNNKQAHFQLCLTHPDVRRLVLGRLRGFIKKDRDAATAAGAPWPIIYDISQNDSTPTYLCCCDSCKKVIAREGGESGLLLDFINSIAAGIAPEYPDIFIQTFAYQSTVQPPRSRIRPASNVILRYCDPFNISEIHRPLLDQVNTEYRTLFKSWAAISANIALWDYWRTFYPPRSVLYAAPFSIIPALQSDLIFYQSNNVKMFFTQYERHTGMAAEFNKDFISFHPLTVWLGYKLLQEPQQNLENLFTIFFNAYYGSASKIMRQYLNYLQQKQNSQKDNLTLTDAINRSYFNTAFFTDVLQMLADAESVAGLSKEQKLHIQFERIPVDLAIINLWSTLDLQGGIKGVEFETIIARYQSNMTGFSRTIFAANEDEKIRGKLKADVEAFKTMRLSAPLPAEILKKSEEVVGDFSAVDFSITAPGEQVADPAANTGKAGAVLENDALKKMFPDWEKRKILSFGIYTPSAKSYVVNTVVPDVDYPEDGKYHLYKIEKITIPPDAYLFTSWAWFVAFKGLSRFADGKEYSLYLSLKVSGPRYATGSKEIDGLYVDRIIIVKPNTNLDNVQPSIASSAFLEKSVIWLKADALGDPEEGDEVKSWPLADGSGELTVPQGSLPGGVSFTAPVFVRMPSGRGAVSFDGISTALAVPDLINKHLAGKAFTIFMVSRSGDPFFGFSGNEQTGGGSVPRFYAMRSGLVYNLMELKVSLPSLSNEMEITAFSFDEKVLRSYLNGRKVDGKKAVPMESIPGGALAVPFLAGGTSHAGELAEIIIFDTCLTSAQLDSVNNYLKKKYHKKVER